MTDKTVPPFKISKEAQGHVIAFANKILQAHKHNNELYNKMEIIDQAFARYKATGEDVEVCADVFSKDDITPPMVVSQVESMIAYWADVFLSGYPLFPVVSTPAKRKWAEQLESLLDDHATLGGYVRQLLLFLTDAGKYNFSAIEAEWDEVSQFSVINDYREERQQRLDTEERSFTRLTRWDPYNTVWDSTLAPADVAEHGDYAGHIQLLSRVKFKRLLNRYTKQRAIYNAREAETLYSGGGTALAGHYRMHPTISNYLNAKMPLDQIDWEAYLGGQSQGRRPAGRADNFEVFKFYARIIPADFGISVSRPNTPQIWCFVVVNGQLVIHARRVISAQDRLPVFFGQPKEDGLGIQTQSVAEGVIEFQEAAKTLYNIRFSAARRSVSDRALYDPNIIDPKDINSKAPAPKIPVKINALGNKSLGEAYHQIPFDMRGTETTLQDAAIINEFSKDLTGLNNPMRGQFQRGNKSVTEWEDTMAYGENRLRLSALLLEHQVFQPLKDTLKLNIFQYGDSTIVVSQKTGEVIEVDIAKLREHTMSFRISDGYTPKSKMASAEMLQAGMQMIMSSEILQQQFGPSLPAIFAHIMQLGGVRGLEEYTPERQAQAEAEEGPEGLEAQAMQSTGLGMGADPNAALPPEAMQQEQMDLDLMSQPGAGV